MNVLGQLLQIIGSLGLFLYGMKVMSEGVQKTAGDRMKSILKLMTGNRFAAIFTGFAITTIIQSSSATTVMIISFVNANLMNLSQAIGVILGANIGTTVTGWIVAILGFKVSISALAIPAIAIGAPFLFIRRLKHKDFGEVLVGFGLLFLGLEFLKDSVPDIQQHPDILQYIQLVSNSGFLSMILFVIIGILITAIVQSSSAAMAITLTMAYSGWIGYPAAAAMVLGQNIGTTITAYLASIGTSVTARRASRAHVMFNIIGTIWVMILFNPFLHLVDIIVPGTVFGDADAHNLPQHLAMFHTVFNVINTLLFIPFIGKFTHLIERIVPARPGELETTYEYKFKYISSSLQDTPEIYLLTVKDEVVKMTTVVSDMFGIFRTIFNDPDKEISDEVKTIKRMEEYTDQMQEELSQFLAEISQENLNPNRAKEVNCLVRILNELESIGDSCYNLILLSERRQNKGYRFTEESHEHLKEYGEMVQQFIDFIRDHMDRKISNTDLQTANTFEDRIDAKRNEMRKMVQKDLKEGAHVKSELLLLDKVRHLEHIGDYCINIAEALYLIEAT
ncbi:MAG: Na/Pi cotransporter family protein [Spirochaetia bacterium]|nr:Na/Pi cotransporter family protein [Spirochaetia bacterium]